MLIGWKVGLLLAFFTYSWLGHAAALCTSPFPPNESGHTAKAVKFGIVDAVSAATHYPRYIHHHTGNSSVIIQTTEYDDHFSGSFNPTDPHAQLIKISTPPTAEDIQKLQEAGITHLLAGPINLHMTQLLGKVLGLPIVGPDSSVLTDKFGQQDALRLAGEPFIPGMRLSSLQEALSTYKKLGPSVVVKPNEGWGTEGVQFLDNPGQLLTNCVACSNGLLMQRRVPGVEYFGDFVTFTDPQSGEVKHRFVKAARYRKVVLGSRAPIYSSIRLLPYEGIVQGRIKNQGSRALNVFKVKKGVTHAEFMLEIANLLLALSLTEGVPNPQLEAEAPLFHVEPNFRLPGGDIDEYARRYAYSADSYTQIDAAILADSDPEVLARSPEGWTLVRELDLSFLFAPRDGHFDLNAVLKLKDMYPGVVQEVHAANIAHGASVKMAEDLFGSLGKVVIAHKDPAVVTRVSQEIFEMCMASKFLLPLSAAQ